MSPNQRFLVFVIVVVSIGGYVLCRRADNGGQGADASTSMGPEVSKIADPKLRAVIEELAASFEKLEAVSAETSLKLAEAAGLPGKTSGEGHYKLLRKNGKMMLRYDVMNKIVIDSIDGEVKAGVYVTYEIIRNVYDGEYLYSQVSQHEYKRSRKSIYSPDDFFQLGGLELLRQISRDNALTLLPDEDVDERAAYTIQSAPTNGGLVGTHWFDKQTGIRLRIVEKDADGSEFLRLEVHNIKLNPEFDEGTFRYDHNPKFELVDETQPRPNDSHEPAEFGGRNAEAEGP